MEIRPGYKQTEVGVIPEDWSVDYIGNIAHITTGGRNTQDRIEDGAYPFFVRSQIIERINSYSFDGEAVLTAGDGVGTGKVFHYIRGKFDVHQRVYRITDFSNRLDGFFFYLYFSTNFHNRIMQMTAKSSVDSVRMEMITRMPVPIPGITEQRAISTALSNMNALLDGLDRLITKKRTIKQATMQQLLTGQTRLPGFSGDWKVKRLGNVLAIKHGKSQKYVEASDGSYPILATGGQIGLASQPIYEKPSVLIGRKGTINQPQYMDQPFWSVDTLFYSEMKNSNVAKFFYYRFCLIDWMQYNEASGVPSLNARTIESIELSLPAPEEQTAIATILSDMDTEITALETRRTKTRALKQAMMQALLTGRTRLV
ncbi:restriction endonuclease subunit S [Stutzerimonas nitrititolerans]|uniref:restriction endonuclease subunit S n=1 Tax=Stutzerimonas nitrititolerans TaxID=2482751 RepID=UPI0028A78FD9|nr:restriction endonuclease subunit S [Stutzerimonas nitrititolerans]